MKIISMIIIMAMFASISHACDMKNIIKATGVYTSQDGRVKDHIFKIELLLKRDGSFTGEMDSATAEYLEDGSEQLYFYKEPLQGGWMVNKNVIFLKEKDNKLLPSSIFKIDNGIEVSVIRKIPDNANALRRQKESYAIAHSAFCHR